MNPKNHSLFGGDGRGCAGANTGTSKQLSYMYSLGFYKIEQQKVAVK